jgi:hypothetical protein
LGVRLPTTRRVGCAYIYLWTWRVYGKLEVDLLECQGRGFKTLDVVRELVKLLHDKVILKSRAWARALSKHKVAGAEVMRQVREFIEKGEVQLPHGLKEKCIPIYFFRNPDIWLAASEISVILKAEKRILENIVDEVERLIEKRLEVGTRAKEG